MFNNVTRTGTAVSIAATLVLALGGCGSDTESTAKPSCTVNKLDDGSLSVKCGDEEPVIWTAPAGEQGPEGPAGMKGQSCTVADNGDGTTSISCEDGTSATVQNGGSCTVASDASGSATITCEGGASVTLPPGTDGTDGTDGKTSLVAVRPDAAAGCTGDLVETGLDDNGDGTLDPDEVDSSFDVCDGATGADGMSGMSGADGKNTLVSVVQNGAVGCAGTLVQVGLDDNADGSLDAAEVDSSFDVCNGTNGMDGMDGMDGANGMDGMNGADGKNSLIKVSTESAGANCAHGGKKVEVGTDANDNGVLNASEVDAAQTSYLCDDPAIYVQISTGSFHTCGLTAAGGVQCWGQNQYGQLGNGTNTNRSRPVHVVGLTSGVTAVTAGGYMTCALTTTGGVKCWGRNQWGQLGDGTTNNRNTPVDVNGLTSGAVWIKTGSTNTCAVTSAGAAKCWGRNNKGQLGDGTITNRSTPVDVTGLGSGVTSIAMGTEHTCAVTTAGGVKCWGFGSAGQLGNGASVNQLTPVDVIGLGARVTSVSLQGSNSCALTTTGGVKCWGHNNHGQLGNGTTNNRNTPGDVNGLDSGVASISMGSSFACATTSGGATLCWGYNQHGQLGDGTSGSSARRTVPTGVVGMSAGTAAVSAGYRSTCALMTTGGAKCWGDNSYGQFGNSTTTSSSTPVDVRR